MNCTSCGHDNPTGNRFCGGCGAPALLEWRAELAAVLGDDAACTQFLQQAIQGNDDIGAPLQAARLKNELSAGGSN